MIDKEDPRWYHLLELKSLMKGSTKNMLLCDEVRGPCIDRNSGLRWKGENLKLGMVEGEEMSKKFPLNGRVISVGTPVIMKWLPGSEREADGMKLLS